ncbi:MAG: PQQ-like beta-propeller repeat protein [Candidatus Hydrogenedentes bacterium]|nr:PQQ-like beta-propeller repeat protein [Candidatus Hydrogenedentota bacterium]
MTEVQAILLVGAVCLAACASPAFAAEAADSRFTDHGVGAAVSESRGVMAASDADGTPIILAIAMDTYGGGLRASLLVIDAGTGATEQFWYPRQEAPSPPDYCLLTSSRNRLYLMFGDAFLEFDVARREWTFAKDLGLGTAMALHEAADGTVYAGTYPESHLLAFNPDTRELVHLGQLDPEEKYPLSIASDSAGWLYAGIGTAGANLVAFNPATGERRQLVDEAVRGTGSGVVCTGQDGQVYGRLPDQAWLRLSDGAAHPVDGPRAPGTRPRSIGWGGVYGEFPGGGRIDSFDLAGKSCQITDASGNSSTIVFDYVSEGATITSIDGGPSGTVFGSTCHPFRLFACNPADGGLVNLGGLKQVGGGNVCDMAWHGDILYGAAYCGGFLYAFDTTKPWRDTDGDDANPRLVDHRPRELTRPRTALLHPDARHVIWAGFPAYGLVGGGMGFYDIQAGEASVIENDAILPGHSAITLKALPNGDVVGGTSIEAPGGGHEIATAGRLFVMDWQERKVVFDIEPVPGAREINCIEVDASGKVYGLSNTGQFFVFEPATRQIVHTADVSAYGSPLRPNQSLIRTPGGQVLMLLSRTLLEIAPDSFSVSVMAQLPEGATAGTAVVNGRIYYAAGAHVWSCALNTD